MGVIRSLTVGEDPYQRGLAHGEAFKADVASNLETYIARFEASGLTRSAAMDVADSWADAIARQNGEYAEEMRGIADGSGHSLPAIALLNARYEVAFSLFGKDARAKEKAFEEADGCTTFGVLGHVSADGHTWLGQNWDWLAGILGHNLVLRVKRKERPSFVCLTEAGIVGGKMGVNSVGIGLVENGLASSHDGKYGYAKPFHVRCREILDADRFDDALRPVLESPRCSSGNFVVGSADGGGEIIDFETSPEAVTPIHPVDGVVSHSNHFVTPGHGRSEMERIAPSTLFRASRIRRQIETRRDRLDMAAFTEAMCDHFNAPNAICRHPDERLPAAKRTMTTAAVLIDLDARILHVANGPPCSNPFVAFPLDAD
ncbi:C45 family autoproteolytic acyltransferase/hydolase [Acuticoccus kandeliae]|uniref:C45 family autoproteolytic acyltransferase/hydolase n=1 Tax=Acuticoccus kandeliae TaxID=2073160 RepID=UPI001300B702|nr:C45 family peptidase [Acuticoccus kandeliae]